MGRYQSGIKGTKGLGKLPTTTKGVSTIISIIWLTKNRQQNNDQNALTGKQEEMTTLNTIPVVGGDTRQTNTHGKHLG